MTNHNPGDPDTPHSHAIARAEVAEEKLRIAREALETVTRALELIDETLREREGMSTPNLLVVIEIGRAALNHTGRGD